METTPRCSAEEQCSGKNKAISRKTLSSRYENCRFVAKRESGRGVRAVVGTIHYQNESITQVEMIVEGLDFHDVKISGLALDIYLASFNEELAEQDVGMLELGFDSVTKANWTCVRLKRRTLN